MDKIQKLKDFKKVYPKIYNYIKNWHNPLYMQQWKKFKFIKYILNNGKMVIYLSTNKSFNNINDFELYLKDHEEMVKNG